MEESLCSKSQFSLCRLKTEHYNNGLTSKHNTHLMNKLFEPHYQFSPLKSGGKREIKTLTSLHKSKREGTWMCTWWICSHLQVLSMNLYRFVMIMITSSFSVSYCAMYIQTNVSVFILCVSLTERSFHVIGLTCLGIPDQLSFRSSSAERERENILGSLQRIFTKVCFLLKLDQLTNNVS